MGEARNLKVWAALLVAALAAGVLMAAALPAATGPAEAAGRYKTVTKTFSSAQRITIPISGNETEPAAANPYPSDISVGGLRRGEILDANLTLRSFSHTFTRDVDVMVSHRGVNRTVMSDVGSAGADSFTLRLDDEAASPMPEDDPLQHLGAPSGSFKPTNVTANFEDVVDDVFPDPAPAPSDQSPLSGFDGTNPNGPWQLWVADDYSIGDSGRFGGGWSVTITARVLR